MCARPLHRKRAAELNHIFIITLRRIFLPPLIDSPSRFASFSVIKCLIIQWGTRNSICAVAGGRKICAARLSCSKIFHVNRSCGKAFQRFNMLHKYTLALLLALNLSPAFICKKYHTEKISQRIVGGAWSIAHEAPCMIESMSVWVWLIRFLEHFSAETQAEWNIPEQCNGRSL